jgi:hypothetical protein
LAHTLGCKPSPTAIEEHRPVITSVSAFPSSIALGDSAIIIADATDSDGDALVYDWITDGHLRIKDATAGTYLYDTPNNHVVVFYVTASPPRDSIGIQCTARDPNGNNAVQTGFIELLP